MGWSFHWVYWFLLNDGIRPPVTLFIISLVLICGGWVVFSQPGALESKTTDSVQSDETLLSVSREAHAPHRQYSIWQALGVSLRLFSPVSVVMGEEWVPSQKPIKIKVKILSISFPVSPTVYSTFCLQIAGWILVPLLVATWTGLLKWQ